jgi:hypothetical protein
MKKYGVAHPGTGSQVAGLFSSIAKAILMFVQRLNYEQLRWLIFHKTQTADAICEAINSLVKGIDDLPDYLAWWQNFYREERIDIDFFTLEISDKPEGDWWLVLVAPMTYSKAIQALCKKFEVWVFKGDLDRIIDFDKEQRRAVDRPYAIWVKAGVEAELDIRSEIELGNASVATLMEGLLLEVFYFDFISGGGHLNMENIARCSGSRYIDGGIPDILFNLPSNKVLVGRVSPDDGCCRLRHRRPVS